MGLRGGKKEGKYGLEKACKKENSLLGEEKARKAPASNLRRKYHQSRKTL